MTPRARRHEFERANVIEQIEVVEQRLSGTRPGDAFNRLLRERRALLDRLPDEGGRVGIRSSALPHTGQFCAKTTDRRSGPENAEISGGSADETSENDRDCPVYEGSTT